MVKVGIIGGAGYTAGELIRLLINHPQVEIAFIHSSSNAGNLVSEVHGGLYGECDLRFSAEYDLKAIDLLFLCSAHGASAKFMAENEVPAELKIVDLAQDFRDEHDGFVYGLAEMQREKIAAEEREKLQEELTEYQESKSPEELADLLEVMMAAAKARGHDFSEVEAIRREKAEKRGRFNDRIYLESVTE